MTVISVDVPEYIAKKFVNLSVVSGKDLYEEFENENYQTVKVGENARTVLAFLKSIK